MKNRQFVMTWGRKLFFGLCWPLMSLLGLLYLKSQLIPQTAVGWTYFITTFIGHYGLITTLLYFLVFGPLVYLFPTYYFSRFSSLIIIVTANLLVLADAIVFSQYRLHINPLLAEVMFNGVKDGLFALPKVVYIVTILALLVLMIIIWLKGNAHWQRMRGRFSNPVSNWYLLVILVSFIIGQGLHIYGDAQSDHRITRYSSLFPLNLPTTAKKLLRKVGFEGDRSLAVSSEEFKYPLNEMKCDGTENPNIVLITVDEFRPLMLESETAVNLRHLSSHASSYRSHYSSGLGADSTFSLIYSLPAFYAKAIEEAKKAPVLFQELSERDYKIITLPNYISAKFPELAKNAPAYFDASASDPTEGEDRPFFSYLNLSLIGDDAEVKLAEVDAEIGRIVSELHANGSLDHTVMIVTGRPSEQNSSVTPSDLLVPLIVAWPDRVSTSTDRITSHYDIVPTLMKEIWECRNNPAEYSYGSNLKQAEQKEILVTGDYTELNIHDFKNETVTSIETMSQYKVKNFSNKVLEKSKAREDLILQVLKNLFRFNQL